MADHRTQPIAPPPLEAAASASVRPLGQLGRYELLSLLAKGGMGEVYLARARGLGGFEKLVVIKRSLPVVAAENEPLFAEARLVATLQHTNIVQVYDVESDGPTVFLAMEFLHGQDVRAIVKRSWGKSNPLPLEHAIAIALSMCAGLHYAHDKRDTTGTPLEIVHRDVSPSNVFVTYDGGVKLIDFGIAKATTLPSETQLGTIKGKPGYMSPEQCRGEPLDRRSDIFCVGIMLYEMIVGRRPFRGDNEYMLYREICEVQPPRPSQLSPALEDIIMTALAKDRRERQPTAQALQEQLARFASEQRLDVSQFALGRYMATVFHDELEAWRHAQRTGQSLIDHVIARVTASVPIIDVIAAADLAASSASRSPGTSMVTTQAGSKNPAPKRRQRVAMLALGGALLAVGAATAIAITSYSTSPSPSTSPSTPTPTSPSTPTPTSPSTSTSTSTPSSTPTPTSNPASASTSNPAPVSTSNPGATDQTSTSNAGATNQTSTSDPASTSGSASMSNPATDKKADKKSTTDKKPDRRVRRPKQNGSSSPVPGPDDPI